ncbi:MHS family MFS transporter [Pseudomonas veronii]|nr:MFS transporter [Pseudomonas veronii]MCT8965260.1 MHS family MFS transporter [Pseudomonas veronii]
MTTTKAPIDAVSLMGANTKESKKESRKVIIASSVGAVIEYYDFFLYGSLAGIIAKQFFSGLDPTSAFIFALLAFAAGFVVRPLGAILFGRLGDMIGRKYTFMITLLLIGTTTFIVGFLPSYASIGMAAPIILIVLRLCQGLALGGEYGGAATYVAEHAPVGRRGAYTSWVQTTATLGFLLSLIVILAVRSAMTTEQFEDWGWRVPFLLSLLLFGLSVYIRVSMKESPVFLHLKESKTVSKAPVREAFGEWKNLRVVLIALFGLCAGQSIVWYTSQFYALFFLTQILKVETAYANTMFTIALVLSMPLFILCGALSDRIGRKWMIMGGILLAAVSYSPLFKGLTHYANPALERAQNEASIIVIADPDECTFQGNPIAREVDFRSSCDIAKRVLAQSAANYRIEDAPSGSLAQIRIGDQVIVAVKGQRTADGQSFDPESKRRIEQFRADVKSTMQQAGYPASADPKQINYPMVVLILFVLMVFVALTYGPLAALLVEMFPPRIRYTSMSLPYHIGAGWFGGLLPTIAFALVAQQGNIYAGLTYVIGGSIMTVVLGVLFLRDSKAARMAH